MEISRLDENTLLISGIDPVMASLLRQISRSADPTGSEAATARIFSPPTDDVDEMEFAEDWREYVEPELAKLFQSALQVIDGDLKKLRSETKSGEATLTVPRAHMESWIHGLNQARIVLAERHSFGEKEMRRTLPLTTDPRSFALLQIRIYDFLLDFFLHEIERE